MTMARAAVAPSCSRAHNSAPRRRSLTPRGCPVIARNSSSTSPTPHVYPEGDWRNDALKASLSDEGRVHHEARGRNCTYALTIAYDGEAYLGFQYQPKGKTVQDEVEKALSKLTGEDREFIGLAASGRTDTGVHARGQVVHFYTREPFQDLARAHRSLNGILPKDIRVTEIRRPHPAFHARFHAVRKTYHYYIDPRLTLDPFERRYALHVGWRPPDLDKLRAATSAFVGTHDFSAFSNKSRDGKSKERDPTRSIYRFDVVEQEDGLLRLEVEGNGFLYRMVRNMVGAALLEATAGKEGEVARLLAGGDRRAAPMGAPPHGLFLHEVVYPEALWETWEPPEGRDEGERDSE